MRLFSSSCLGILAALFLTAIPAAPLHAGIVAHWSFDDLDESGNYPDSVGNAHPATPADKSAVLVYNGTIGAPFGKAVALLGPSKPNSFLTVPPLTNVQTSSLTVAAWVNLSSQNFAFVLADWPSMTQSAYAFGFHPFRTPPSTAQPNGNITSTETVGGRGNNTNRRSILDQKLPDRAIPLNEWHQVVWVWNRTAETLTFYYDGTIWGEAKRNPAPPGSNYSATLDIAVNNLPVRIGSQQHTWTGQPANLTGAIDELWIFDEVLTPIQLRNLREHNDVRGKPAPIALDPAPVPAPGPIAPANPPVDTTKTAVAPPPVRPTPDAASASDPGDSSTKAPPTFVGTTPPSGGMGVGRLIGVVSCLLVIILMASYLTWAFVERAKLQARRA